MAVPADEILGSDMIEFPAGAACVEIAFLRHFIIHHWHTFHYGAFSCAPRVRPSLNG